MGQAPIDDIVNVFSMYQYQTNGLFQIWRFLKTDIYHEWSFLTFEKKPGQLVPNRYCCDYINFSLKNLESSINKIATTLSHLRNQSEHQTFSSSSQITSPTTRAIILISGPFSSEQLDPYTKEHLQQQVRIFIFEFQSIDLHPFSSVEPQMQKFQAQAL